MVETLFAGLVGITLGLIGGWARSWGAFLTVRSVEIIMCFPPVLLAPIDFVQLWQSRRGQPSTVPMANA